MTCRSRIGVSLAAAFAAVLFLASASAATAPTGANTGDGSTPFTGLAQAPEANLFAGAATTSIPIDVPPGRGGLTPSLTLTYTSTGRQSPYGFGWDLPLGTIQRCLKHGVPSCSDPRHRNDFVLTLPTGTVECTLEPQGYCRPLIEESFLDIRYAAGSNSWQVVDRDGRRYTFGAVREARTGSNVDSLFLPEVPASGAQPYQPCSYTFSWALTRVEDLNGNFMTISYASEEQVLYPQLLAYGGNSIGGLPPIFTVGFLWENLVGHGPVTSVAGFPAQTRHRLRAIEVRYGTELVRRYDLSYEPSDLWDGTTRSASFLRDVVLSTPDGPLRNAAGEPARTTFLYQRDARSLGFGAAQTIGPFLSSHRSRLRVEAVGSHASFLERDVFDINGDGIADLVDAPTCGADWKVYLGSPVGFSAAPISWSLSLECQYIRVRHNVESSKIVSETVDINGDGIADYVEATPECTTSGCDYGHWTVYLGRAGIGGAGWGFDPLPVRWPKPAELRDGYTRVTISHPTWVTEAGWNAPTITWRDLIDMNGDGLLDLVSTEERVWKVWLNTGTGFASAPLQRFEAKHPFLRLSANGHEMIGLYDVNGDSLPDQVVACDRSVYPWCPGSSMVEAFWQVYLHTGRAISMAAQTWTLGLSSFAPGIRRVVSQKVVRDFFDVNGDALPDLVEVIDGLNWHVYLNSGFGFRHGPRHWAAGSNRIRDAYAYGVTEKDTFDFDGDGLVDFVDFDPQGNDSPSYWHVRRARAGAWCASADGLSCAGTVGSSLAPHSQGGWDGLLVQMENGIGGTTFLEYRPSTQWDNNNAQGVPQLPVNLWTVSAIESDDGMCDTSGNNCVGVAGAAHTVRSELRYARGVFDRAAREFRGFGVVESLDADGNLKRSEFAQTHALKGKLLVEERFAADPVDPYARPLDRSLHFWQCADPDTGTGTACPAFGLVWVRNAGSVTETFSNFDYNHSRWAATSRFSWQACDGKPTGNPRTVILGGADGIAASTHTTYACSGAAHVLDKPVQVEVRDNSGRTLEKKWFFYDGDGQGNPLPHGVLQRGNLTRAEAWLDQATEPLQPPPCTVAPSQRCTATTTAYNAMGGVIRTTDANGRTTSIDYSADTHYLYPAITTNSLGHKVGTGYNVVCGRVEWQTLPYVDSPSGPAPPPSDPSHAKARRRHDKLCRLTRTANADENIDTSPHEVYLYKLGWLQQPTVTAVFKKEPHYSQTWPPGSPESQALPHPSYLPVWTITDALGRPIQRQRNTVVEGQLTTVASVSLGYDQRGHLARQYVPFTDAVPGQFTSPAAAVGFQELSYDPAGRLVSRVNPDGSVRTWDHRVAWQTTAADECVADPGCTGGKSVELRDVAGRVVERQLHVETSGGDALAAKTRYTYDALGRLLTSEQWNGSAWDVRTKITHTYDSLGRRLSLEDPDSGRWTYGYDFEGNLRWQDDPEPSQHVQLCYDALNRVRRKYVYTSADFSPAYLTCTLPPTVEYVYDDTANPYGIGRLAAVSDPSGSTWFQYDLRGRVASVNKSIEVRREPPYQNDPPQWALFLYTYDAADHVTSIRYPDGEIVAHGYDVSGQLNRLENDSGKVYLSGLTYDTFGRRRRISYGDGTVDERSYHTDKQRGYRLRSISTRTSTATFLNLDYASYDRRGLITRIEDRAYPGAGDPRSSTVSYTYDGLGRLVRASGHNLQPAPNDVYQYDALGNIVRKENQIFTYHAVRPHQLASINGVSSGIAHDANGSRLGKPGRTYQYDAEGRLRAVDGGAVTFHYDYSGRQVAKAAGYLINRYFNELAEARNGVLVKYYFAGDLRIASRENFSWRVAALEQPRSTMLAMAEPPAASAGPSAAVVLKISAASGTMGIVLLAMAPGRGRRRIGLSIRRSQVLLAIAVWILGTLPLPAPVGPRASGAGGTWNVCYTCPQLDNIDYYHTDHLGSTQLVTRNGVVSHHIRYTPFGSVRGRYNSSGTAISATANAYEFTGYESDHTSGLQYAGARFYDPDLGLFLTHDPQRQFPSPYAYGPWNPVNGVDPDGEFFFLIPILAAIIEAAAAILATVQAAVATLLPYVKAAVLAAVEGAAKGAAIGLGKGAIEAIVSGDTEAILTGFKNGAISGAIGGLLIDGSGLGNVLDEVAGSGLQLKDLASPSPDLLSQAPIAGIRGALSGATRGVVGGATKAVVEGKDPRRSILHDGLLAGSLGGAFGNLLQPAIDEITLAALGPVIAPVAGALGLPPTVPLAPPDGSLNSMLSGDIVRAAAGGALAQAHKGVGEFVRGGVKHLGRFDPGDLGSGLLKGGFNSGKDAFADRARAYYDHHIKPATDGPWRKG